MYFTPEVYNSQNYLITVDVENVNACKEGLNGGGGGPVSLTFMGPLIALFFAMLAILAKLSFSPYLPNSPLCSLFHA